MSRYDIIIFGASGYTGRYVVEHIANVAEDEKITWCVAGRSQRKLEETLQFVGTVTNRDLSKIEIIIANVDDDSSLNDMCKRARVLINTVGPYRLWGEQVVRAAIQNGCHHLDISGEPIYLENCQLKYNDDAKNANVYVIGAAGADSIPCDMGIEYLAANCATDINGISTYLSFKGPKGAANYGTWHSAVLGIGDEKLLAPLRRKLYTTRPPAPKYKLPRKNFLYNDSLSKWAVVLPATDRAVAKRTQYYHYTVEKKRPIQVETYLCQDHFGMVLGMMLFGIIFAIMTSFEYGKSLLLKYPEIFSFGIFSKEGVPREQVVKRRYEIVFQGEAFNSRMEDPDAQHESAPSRRVACKVSGPEFGYVNCGICIGQCALVLLKEANTLPPGGGVYAPGAAFSKTPLIQRLEKHGVHFEIMN